MTINELRQKRAALIAQARALVDGADAAKRALTQDEEVSYNAMMDEVSKLAVDINRRESLASAEANLRQSVDEPIRMEPDNRQNGSGRNSDEYRRAFATYLGMGREGLNSTEARALQADGGTLGGYLVTPVQFVNSLIAAMDNQVFVRQFATVFPVTSAESLGAASLDNDPADPAWTAEIGSVSEDSTMSFGKREIHPHQLTKLIKISMKLLRKTPDVEDLVINRLAYKFGVTLENAYLNGTGAGQPLGVFTASADGVSTSRDVSTGNTATSMTFDGLIEAKYKLKQQYWAKARWIFHQDGAKQLAKLKDGDGQYIWRESVRAGEPDRLLNLPVHMSQYAPNTFTANLYVGILGDFSFYWIADALNMEMQRLVELYAATSQVGLVGRFESDGMPVLAEAFARVKLGS